jgi:hypothetical protein
MVMKTILGKVGAAIGAGMIAGGAHAASVIANFSVNVNYTPTCVVATGPAPVVAFGAYTAFGPAVSAPPVTLSVNCSRSTAVSLLTAPSSFLGVFAVSNLHYTLGYAMNTVPGTAATATAGGIGGPQVSTVTITGNLPSQAGKQPPGASVNDTQFRGVLLQF